MCLSRKSGGFVVTILPRGQCLCQTFLGCHPLYFRGERQKEHILMDYDCSYQFAWVGCFAYLVFLLLDCEIFILLNVFPYTGLCYHMKQMLIPPIFLVLYVSFLLGFRRCKPDMSILFICTANFMIFYYRWKIYSLGD